jgi:phosphoribosylanthranilate isomerase
MLQLKVCGMRESNNIAELIQVQPNFIGFIFHEKSPRNIITIPQVEIPAAIKKVGVFVNEEAEFILEKANQFGLDFVQLHGKESSSFCEGIKSKNLKVIKAFNISKEFDFNQLVSYESSCDYFLFDAFGKNAGGNGITFDWELLSNYKGAVPFLLSGGINETMINNIKEIDHPQFVGLDINSGFEIRPALKNIEKIKLFKDELQR